MTWPLAVTESWALSCSPPHQAAELQEKSRVQSTPGSALLWQRGKGDAARETAGIFTGFHIFLRQVPSRFSRGNTDSADQHEYLPG